MGLPEDQKITDSVISLRLSLPLWNFLLYIPLDQRVNESCSLGFMAGNLYFYT